jgi:hypothetical protein
MLTRVQRFSKNYRSLVTDQLEQFPVEIDLHDGSGKQVFKDVAALVKAQYSATMFIRQLTREMRELRDNLRAVSHLLEVINENKRLSPYVRDTVGTVLELLQDSNGGTNVKLAE